MLWPSVTAAVCVCVMAADRAGVCLRAYVHTQTSSMFRCCGVRQDRSLMSHFFIVTVAALLHLSPLEVKKVIKGSPSDSSLCLIHSKNVVFFLLILSLQTPVTSPNKSPSRLRAAGALSRRCVSLKFRMLCHSFSSSATPVPPRGARQPFISA